jgi:hypothetical protein
MIGSRRENVCHYVVNDKAAQYDASVSKETHDWPKPTPTGAQKVPTSESRTRGRLSKSPTPPEGRARWPR